MTRRKKYCQLLKNGCEATLGVTDACHRMIPLNAFTRKHTQYM